MTEPNGAVAEVAALNTVFVDTSLDTHLALLVRRSDTVSDFKKKVALEHMQCFPEIGAIEVHSVKVKRRSNFYHMPDIMLVWSAFHRVKSNWFLSVDASSIQKCLSIRNSMEHGTNNGVKSALTNIDDDVIGLTSDGNRNEILPSAFLDGASEKNVVSEMIANVEKPAEKITDSHRSIYLEEHNLGTESHAKEKRKIRRTKDRCHNPSMGGDGAMLDIDGKNGKTTMSDSIVNISDLKNDQNDGEGARLSEGATPPTMAEKNNLGSTMDSQNLNGSYRRKEGNMFMSMVDYGLGQDSPTQQLGVVPGMVPDRSAKLLDTSGGEDVNTARTKRKKKKVPKTAAKIKDVEHMEQIGEGQRIKPPTDTHKFDKLEEGKGFPFDHDHEAIMSSNSKAPGQVDPNLALKEASVLQDAEKSNTSIVISQKLLDSNQKKEDNVVESTMGYDLDQDVPAAHLGGVFTKMQDISARLDSSGGTGNVNIDGKNRKKKKVHKIVAELQDTRLVDHIGKCEMKKPHAETIDSVKKEPEKGLSSEHDNEVTLPSDSKVSDHVGPDFALKEARVMQVAEVVMEPEISSDIKKGKKRKRVKKSDGTSIQNSGITDIHNGISGSLGLHSPSSDNILKETEKEESIGHAEGKDFQMKIFDGFNYDAQEKVLDANKIEADLEVKMQKEQRSEDLSIINKKMVEKTNNSAYADFPTAETESTILVLNEADKDNGNTENRNEKATRKRKTQKRTVVDVQENIPNKDQKFDIKPLATKETEVKVEVMHELVVNTDDLAENPGNGRKDSTLQKPSSVQNKNRSLDKSSSVMSNILQNLRGNERPVLGLNVKKMTMMKTPKNQLLFAKSGAVFQDNSGESSGDEMHSKFSALSPSDSSSISGDSAVESELSHNITHTGSTDAEGKSTGQINTSKLDTVSSRKDLTMDLILRSSKRFKNAKQQASQTESLPIECNPDAQPV